MGCITYGSILGVDEHPFATYFDVHQGYRVLTHSHMKLIAGTPTHLVCLLAFVQNQRAGFSPFALVAWSGQLEGRGSCLVDQSDIPKAPALFCLFSCQTVKLCCHFIILV